MNKVMVAPSHLANLPGEFRDTLVKAGFQPVYPKRNAQMTEAEVIEQLPGIRACLAGSEPYNRKVLAALPDLKIIARAGVGYDGVDVPACTERGIAVTFAPGTNQEAVAEHTFLLMLALAKNLLGQDSDIRKGKWPRKANLPLRGQTLGIVGLGRIGKAVAERARVFHMKPIAYDPFADHDFALKNGIELLSFEDMLRQSDYVTLHLPAMDGTEHLIRKETLKLMKPTAFLINTSRGTVIHEGDLYEAIREKRIAGAGLDVFEEEPPAADHPLFTLPNVVLTAHTAGVDWKSRDDMALAAAQAIAKLSNGEWPAFQIVNPEVKAKFQW